MSARTENSSASSWPEFVPLPRDANRAVAERSTEPFVRGRGTCQFCKGRRFLRSGLRVSDIGSIFLLHYPVRCLRCRQRQFTDFMTASLSLAAGSPVYSEHKKRENWGAWTSGSDREAIEALREKLKNDTPSDRA
ncbi:MAG TPA: hypothetical protein VNU94_00605 [Acidobacteriaceae bacterium]|jgi:hypothetical protein|nr:hypothetical protein [Acidobacteriaceae bacterium]